MYQREKKKTNTENGEDGKYRPKCMKTVTLKKNVYSIPAKCYPGWSLTVKS